MSEEEVIKEIKDMIIAFDVQGYIREKGFIKEELKASNVLQEMLDLYNKQKQEAEHYKAVNSIIHKCLFNIAEKVGITKSGITESMIIDAIDNNYISKDKIRDTLSKFQNEYGEDLETTDRLFIGKEVVQYGEDMIDEIAKELDIKLAEE